MYFASVKDTSNGVSSQRIVKTSQGSRLNLRSGKTGIHESGKEELFITEKVQFFRRRSFANCDQLYNQTSYMKKIDEIFPKVLINEHEKRRIELLQSTRIDLNKSYQGIMLKQAVRYNQKNRNSFRLQSAVRNPRLSILISQTSGSDRNPQRKQSNFGVQSSVGQDSHQQQPSQEKEINNTGSASKLNQNQFNQLLGSSNRKSLIDQLINQSQQIDDNQNNKQEQNINDLTQTSNFAQAIMSKKSPFSTKKIPEPGKVNENLNGIQISTSQRSISPPQSPQNSPSSSPQSLNQSVSIMGQSQNPVASHQSSVLSTPDDSPSSPNPLQRMRNNNNTNSGFQFTAFSDEIKKYETSSSFRMEAYSKPMETQEIPKQPINKNKIQIQQKQVVVERNQKDSLLKPFRFLGNTYFQTTKSATFLQTNSNSQFRNTLIFNSSNVSEQDKTVPNEIKKVIPSYFKPNEKKEGQQNQIIIEQQKPNETIQLSKQSIIKGNSTLSNRQLTQQNKFFDLSGLFSSPNNDRSTKKKALSMHVKSNSGNSPYFFATYLNTRTSHKSTFASTEREYKNPCLTLETHQSTTQTEEKTLPLVKRNNLTQKRGFQHNRSISTVILLSHPPPPSLSQYPTEKSDEKNFFNQKHAYSAHFSPLNKNITINPKTFSKSSARSSTFAQGVQQQKQSQNNSQQLPTIFKQNNKQ